MTVPAGCINDPDGSQPLDTRAMVHDTHPIQFPRVPQPERFPLGLLAMSSSPPSPKRSLSHSERLQRATVLTELGEMCKAEADVAHVLEQTPDELEALSLFAKLKHMRGELSLAIACAAQIHARNPAPGDVARMHLESMLHLAHDPERGAGEFIAIGQYRLVQKPTAYLALEGAFQLYVNRRPHEARRVCNEVAQRYRGNDPEVYKLAVLAEAWISDMLGDLPAAVETLERLGGERGFETDLDRLIALADLYERVGTREKLEAAINICRYLEQHDGRT